MGNLESRILQVDNNGFIEEFNFEHNSKGIFIPINVRDIMNRKTPLVIAYECDTKVDDGEYDPDKDPRIFLMAHAIGKYGSQKIDFLESGGTYNFRNSTQKTLILTPEIIREDSSKKIINALRVHMDKIKNSTIGYFPEYYINCERE